jgi:hypothetical protein
MLFIKSWADEYDSDMENELKELSNSKSFSTSQKLNSDKNINDLKYNLNHFGKFSDRICSYNSTINYRLFNTVENSEYSCLMPWYVYQVNKHLKEMYYNCKVNKIVDVGANIGVDSINFLYNFPNSKLIAFEIDNNTYNALCKNFVEFSYITKIFHNEELLDKNSKIQAYNKDFISYIDYVKDSDIVFIDAPWGGKIYKDKKNISIYLQPEDNYYNFRNYDKNKNIIHITKQILQTIYNVKSVILKVPYNYEFKQLENELFYLDKNLNIIYKNIYKGNSNYVSFVLIFIYK